MPKLIEYPASILIWIYRIIRGLVYAVGLGAVMGAVGLIRSPYWHVDNVLDLFVELLTLILPALIILVWRCAKEWTQPTLYLRLRSLKNEGIEVGISTGPMPTPRTYAQIERDSQPLERYLEQLERIKKDVITPPRSE